MSNKKKKMHRHPHPVHGGAINGRVSRYELERQAWKMAEDGFRINAATMLLVLHEKPFGFGYERVRRLVNETRKLMLTFSSGEEAVRQCRERTKWDYPGLNWSDHNKHEGEWIRKQAMYSMTQVEKGFAAMIIVLKEQFRMSRPRLELSMETQNSLHDKLLQSAGDVDTYARKIREAFRRTFGHDLDRLFDEELEAEDIFDENVSLEIDD